MITTQIGYATSTSVVVRGRDLAHDILGKLDFLDMIFLTALGRTPSPQEKNMLNVILVTAAGHGITPSVLAARLTILGAPEALQGAVAAGLLGGGNAYLGPVQNIAQTLLDVAQGLEAEASDEAVARVAGQFVDARLAARQPILGIGSSTHGDHDPRVPIMKALAAENGFHGLHWRLLDAVAEALGIRKGKTFGINGAGALAAIVADMGLSPVLARGLMLTGRCASLVAQILEEESAPMAQDVWNLVLAQDPRTDQS